MTVGLGHVQQIRAHANSIERKWATRGEIVARAMMRAIGVEPQRRAENDAGKTVMAVKHDEEIGPSQMKNKNAPEDDDPVDLCP